MQVAPGKPARGKIPHILTHSFRFLFEGLVQKSSESTYNSLGRENLYPYMGRKIGWNRRIHNWIEIEALLFWKRRYELKLRKRYLSSTLPGEGCLWRNLGNKRQVCWKRNGTVILGTWNFKSCERMRLLWSMCLYIWREFKSPVCIMCCILCHRMTFLNQEVIR